ncbi:AAA family ATPase [Sphingobacterium sp. KU25419]|nr:AAA family ATPase [Sphingobacterium sp. KU25419]
MSTAINKIISIIDSNVKKESFSHFVLQGGAGSGKTESLKQIIHYISENHPTKKIVCITHTNLAADEIKHRVNNPKHKISTIHSS